MSDFDDDIDSADDDVELVEDVEVVQETAIATSKTVDLWAGDDDGGGEYVATRMLSGDPRIQGMHIPTNTNYANATKGEQRCWVATMEELMSRGVESPTEIMRITGLDSRAVDTLKKTVMYGWAGNLTADKVNTRREQLYREVERVKQNAWGYFNYGRKVGADVKEQGALLKLILDATSQQAKMSGVNTMGVQINHTVETKFKTAGDIEAEAARLVNVDLSTLEQLGNLLASKMGEDSDE